MFEESDATEAIDVRFRLNVRGDFNDAFFVYEDLTGADFTFERGGDEKDILVRVRKKKTRCVCVYFYLCNDLEFLRNTLP